MANKIETMVRLREVANRKGPILSCHPVDANEHLKTGLYEVVSAPGFYEEPSRAEVSAAAAEEEVPETAQAGGPSIAGLSASEGEASAENISEQSGNRARGRR